MNVAMSKRLAVAVVVMVVIVFGSESVLALLRHWTIDVETQVTDAAGLVVTPDATVDASVTATPGPTPTPQPFTSLKPDQHLNVDVTWDYRIGPRFPLTVVHADVLRESDDAIVTSGDYKIDCGTAALSCSGSTKFSLFPKDGNPWQVGDYVLTLTRAYAGLNPQTLRIVQFHVVKPS